MTVPHIVVIGAGVGGLTAGALLAQKGYRVTVLESQVYPGGSASTFPHKGYRFESGATVAGGFQPDGPHDIVGRQLGITWPVHQHDPAWVVHLPNCAVELRQDNRDVLAQFPASAPFWEEQHHIADLAWRMAAQGLPWPPQDAAELAQIIRVGLSNMPQVLGLIPSALGTMRGWLKRYGLHRDKAFTRLLDVSLLISAQTTTPFVNALYGATALDLPRQGVYHVEGGIGGLAETLVKTLESFDGEVQYRQYVTRLATENGRVTGVYHKTGRRTQKESFLSADFVLANVTPWSLDDLLGEASPAALKREVSHRAATYGAFVLHVGVKADLLPPDAPDHHQIVRQIDGAVGEAETLFMSFSPAWDKTRAPEGYRAVTISTHTDVQPWWDVLATDEKGYYTRKEAYTNRLFDTIERVFPGFRAASDLILPGSPVTYAFYTQRASGMVGGFPQTSLFRARGPRTGISNLRLVGDSIFPGQSTAGVTLGARRVAQDVMRVLPL
jgi:C-3',4' desaturase CrtD